MASRLSVTLTHYYCHETDDVVKHITVSMALLSKFIHSTNRTTKTYFGKPVIEALVRYVSVVS